MSEFLKYHEEHPGEIQPRRVEVEYSVFSSRHGRSTEPCTHCGQDHSVITHSSPLAIVHNKEGDTFVVEEKVWRATGIKRKLDSGTEIEVDIEVERLQPTGYVERVTAMRVVK